jgi:hypothetical protein
LPEPLAQYLRRRTRDRIRAGTWRHRYDQTYGPQRIIAWFLLRKRHCAAHHYNGRQPKNPSSDYGIHRASSSDRF